jgi:hypothetical protein
MPLKPRLVFFSAPDSSSIREKIYQKSPGLRPDVCENNLSSEQSIPDIVNWSWLVLAIWGLLSASCVIGDFVKVNTYANVMHDYSYGKLFYDSLLMHPLMGRVPVGERCYIGANATIIPEITFCPDTIIGAGAVVNKDILEPGTYVGVRRAGST